MSTMSSGARQELVAAVAVPTSVPALEQHGHLSLDPAVRERLLTVSAATIDRRLATARAVTRRRRRPRACWPGTRFPLRRRTGCALCSGRGPARALGRDAELVEAITTYLASRNDNPKAYQWKADGAKTLAKIRRAREALLTASHVT